MKEFIEKLIGRLEEAKSRANRHYNYGDETAYRHSIEIVNQLAEECKISIPLTDYDSIIKFIESEIERTESFSEHETQINIMFYVKELKEKYNNYFCEWKYHRTIDDVPMYETSCYHEFEERFIKKYKFCPYCGKKIKAVE